MPVCALLFINNIENLISERFNNVSHIFHNITFLTEQGFYNALDKPESIVRQVGNFRSIEYFYS